MKKMLSPKSHLLNLSLSSAWMFHFLLVYYEFGEH